MISLQWLLAAVSLTICCIINNSAWHATRGHSRCAIATSWHEDISEHVTLIICRVYIAVNHHIYEKHIKQGMYNKCHLDVKLAPEYLHAKLVICITFLDKPIEDSTQATGFKNWLLVMILK
jgi:hypothetical protein